MKYYTIFFSLILNVEHIKFAQKVPKVCFKLLLKYRAHADLTCSLQYYIDVFVWNSHMVYGVTISFCDILSYLRGKVILGLSSRNLWLRIYVTGTIANLKKCSRLQLAGVGDRIISNLRLKPTTPRRISLSRGPIVNCNIRLLKILKCIFHLHT